ncbi:MAG: transcriptional regulator [Propionibacteriaceae bacterium]|jgi:hypothetical protein|nr:transcriptional regulator [Propionibacteriaceae bacterium]
MAPRGYADVVPYDTPSSLAALHGPTSGLVRVPPNIDTAPDPLYDLGNEVWLRMMYEAAIVAGFSHQQEELLDRNTLIHLWPVLFLPERCREAWEERFPELPKSRSKRR